MRSSLNTISALLSGGRCTDALQLDWAGVEYRHVAAMRAVIAAGYYGRSTLVAKAPATGNRHLAALRGVLKECWRLGYVSVDD